MQAGSDGPRVLGAQSMKMGLPARGALAKREAAAPQAPQASQWEGSPAEAPAGTADAGAAGAVSTPPGLRIHPTGGEHKHTPASQLQAQGEGGSYQPESFGFSVSRLYCSRRRGLDGMVRTH